jgi:hypothetical protein
VIVNRHPRQSDLARGKFHAYLEVTYKHASGATDMKKGIIPSGYTEGYLTGRDWKKLPPTGIRCRRFDREAAKDWPPMPRPP